MSFNWRQLIPYCFIKGKVIGSSLVLPEEDEEHIKNCPAWYWRYSVEIKLYECDSYFLNSMNSLKILDTVQKRRIYARNNHSYRTMRLTQLLALYLTRSEQCRLVSTRTNPSYKLIDPSGLLGFTFRNLKNLFSMKLWTNLYNLLCSSLMEFSPQTLFFGSKFSKKHQATSCFCQPQK